MNYYFIRSASSGGFLHGREIKLQDPWLDYENRDPEKYEQINWSIVKLKNNNYAIRSKSGDGYLNGRTNSTETAPLLSYQKTQDPENDRTLQWKIIPSNDRCFMLQAVSSNGFLNGHGTKECGLENPLLSYDVTTAENAKLVFALQWKIVVISIGNPSSALPGAFSKDTANLYDDMNVYGLFSAYEGLLDGGSSQRTQTAPQLVKGGRTPYKDPLLQFRITRLPNGYFSIHSISSGGFLDGRQNTAANKEKLLLSYDRNPETDPSLQWEIIPVENKYCVVRSVSTDAYIEGRATTTTGDNGALLNHSFKGKAEDAKKQLNLHWRIVIADMLHRDSLHKFAVTDKRLKLLSHWNVYSLMNTNDHGLLTILERGNRASAMAYDTRCLVTDATVQWRFIKHSTKANVYAIRNVSTNGALMGYHPYFPDRVTLSYDQDPETNELLQWELIPTDNKRCLIRCVRSKAFLESRGNTSLSAFCSNGSKTVEEVKTNSNFLWQVLIVKVFEASVFQFSLIEPDLESKLELRKCSEWAISTMKTAENNFSRAQATVNAEAVISVRITDDVKIDAYAKMYATAYAQNATSVTATSKVGDNFMTGKIVATSTTSVGGSVSGKAGVGNDLANAKVEVNASAKAELTATAKAEGTLSAVNDHLKATGGVTVFIKAEASASADAVGKATLAGFELAAVSAVGKANASAEVYAKADGTAQIGKEGVGVGGNVSAGAAAKASASGKANLDTLVTTMNVKGGVETSVGAQVGIGGEAHATFKDGKISIVVNGDIKAIIGLKTDIDFNLDVKDTVEKINKILLVTKDLDDTIIDLAVMGIHGAYKKVIVNCVQEAKDALETAVNVRKFARLAEELQWTEDIAVDIGRVIEDAGSTVLREGVDIAKDVTEKVVSAVKKVGALVETSERGVIKVYHAFMDWKLAD